MAHCVREQVWLEFRLEHVLPHHAFYRLFRLAIVFGVLFLVVFYHNLAFNGEINQLTYRHTLIYFHGLFHRNFQSPVAAEAYVAFAGGSMDIDAETPGG